MPINIFFTFAIGYLLISISIEDFKTMLISEDKLNRFYLFGFLYCLCISLSNKEIDSKILILNHLYSMIIIFICMYLLRFMSNKLLRTNSLGLGDIKLSSASGIWLGIELGFISLCISFFISAVYSLQRKISGKSKSFQPYPFAPFLSIGIFSSWILDKI
tara:strand:+ start:109 stop:588 length:480 start_codon:yes stop_codon:yes gene_type:complete